MKVSEKYQSNKFHTLLIIALREFVKEHFDAAMENKEIDYETYGSAKQVKIKLIVQLSGRISTHLPIELAQRSTDY